jgi:hypothetical protein
MRSKSFTYVKRQNYNKFSIDLVEFYPQFMNGMRASTGQWQNSGFCRWERGNRKIEVKT